MRTILAVAVMALGVVAAAAQPDKKDDKKFESKDGKFAAKFPTFPVEQTKTAGGLTQKIYSADHEKGKGGYIVVYGDLPADVLKAPKPEQVLESGEKGLTEYFKAKVTNPKAITFGPKKLPAREFTAEKEDPSGTFHLRGMIVLSGTRLYQVYVFGLKDFVTSKEADAFLASFDITG